MANNIIEVENLQKVYKITDIFDNIKGKRKVVGVENANFNVVEGEIFAVIGINGAGKTTIMKCILGMIKPDSGTVKVFGKNKISREDYYKIGYLPEISYYPKDVRLKDVIGYYADLYDMKHEQRRKDIPEIIETLGLSGRENDRLEKFSKGMLQRVGIAQAVMNKPKLLFLDEPMTGLDPLGQKLITEIILKLKREGTTVILNTHILSDVEKLSDRIAVVHDKRVIKITDFNSYKKSGYEIVTSKEVYLENNTSKYEDGVYKITIDADNLNETICNIVAGGIKIEAVNEKTPTLEQFFLDQISETEGRRD